MEELQGILNVVGSTAAAQGEGRVRSNEAAAISPAAKQKETSGKGALSSTTTPRSVRVNTSEPGSVHPAAVTQKGLPELPADGTECFLLVELNSIIAFLHCSKGLCMILEALFLTHI